MLASLHGEAISKWSAGSRQPVLRGSVAQLVERSTENRKVTGSTPVGATIESPGIPGLFAFTAVVPKPESQGFAHTLPTPAAVAF